MDLPGISAAKAGHSSKQNKWKQKDGASWKAFYTKSRLVPPIIQARISMDAKTGG